VKNKKRDFVDYVYLSELDSVRVTTEEQIEGERALFNAIVFEGNAVVLTYNQIVDSVTFLHCIRSKKSFDTLLSFFKDKRLLLNQYKKDMNLSKYIQINYSPEAPFKSSYFAFLDEYAKEIKDIILRGLIDSIRYGDDLFLKSVMPAEVKQEHQQDLYYYIKFILKINSYMYEYGCYVYSRPEEELIGHKMKDYILKIYNLLINYDNFNADTLKKVIDNHLIKKRNDSRSEYYKSAEEVVANGGLDIIKKYIDLAYNQTLEYSIPIINRKEHLQEDLLKIISSNKKSDNINLAEVKENWTDGYRITSITSYIFYKLRLLKWKYILAGCPVVEVCRIILTIILSFSLMIVLNLFSGFEKLWISSSIAIILTFMYNYCIDLIEDKFVQKLPEWCATSVFVQLKNLFRDFRILTNRNR